MLSADTEFAVLVGSSPVAIEFRIARVPPMPRMCALEAMAARMPGSVKSWAPAWSACWLSRSATTACSCGLPWPYWLRAAMIWS